MERSAPSESARAGAAPDVTRIFAKAVGEGCCLVPDTVVCGHSVVLCVVHVAPGMDRDRGLVELC